MAERVLLVCTSTIPNVTRALGILHDSLFRSPQVDLLCSSAELLDYERQPQIQRILVLPHRQEYWAALQLCRRIRKVRYDVVAVLWCLEAERAKNKVFALLCGGKRLLVFNENLDCEYLKPSYLKAIVTSRARKGRLLPKSWVGFMQPWLQSGTWRVMRVLLFPIRFFVICFLVAAIYLTKSKN